MIVTNRTSNPIYLEQADGGKYLLAAYSTDTIDVELDEGFLAELSLQGRASFSKGSEAEKVTNKKKEND